MSFVSITGMGLLLLSAANAFPAIPFHCGEHVSLQTAIDLAPPNATLLLSGSCSGPLMITTRNITLESNSGATIDGHGQDAISVTGPVRVTLTGLTIQHGNNGINAKAGAQLFLTKTQVTANKVDGVFVSGSSSATLTSVRTNGNALNGLHAEGSSAITIVGPFTSDANGVFGIDINGSSSITLAQAQLSVSDNTLGIQIGTSASAFISDPTTSITVSENATTGLTIVSGAHMVAFGGTITAKNNRGDGVTVDSKAGLDLDAAATLTSTGNKGDGVHLEETSVLTMFNTTAFSGAPGTTTITTTGNGGNGLSVLTGSNFTMINQAALSDSSNGAFGVFADNGSSITLIQSSVAGNTRADVALVFGSRADINGSTIGKSTCDASALVRGANAFTCPR